MRAVQRRVFTKHGNFAGAGTAPDRPVNPFRPHRRYGWEGRTEWPP